MGVRSSMKRLTISERYYLRDEQEIFDYVSQHDGVTFFDIEMCCHMEHEPVMKHLANLKRQDKIEIIQRERWVPYVGKKAVT